MKDRIPANPGRVLITPESGGAPYYATVTRADNPTQEGTALNKYNLLKDATAAMFGMGSGAVPDGVLQYIGKYAQHWWKRKALVSATRYKEKKTQLASGTFFVKTGAKYYKSASVDPVTGEITPQEPFDIVSVDDYYNAYVVGDFVVNKGASTEYTDNAGVYYFTSGISKKGSSGSGSEFYQNYVQAVIAEAYQINVGGTDFVQSPNPEAYPHSGSDGSFEYTYLGQPWENAVTAPKIATGSYTGAGKFGESNPNTLTFDFEPKLLLVRPASKHVTILAYSEDTSLSWPENYPTGGFLAVTFSGKSVSWYVKNAYKWHDTGMAASGGQTADNQLNKAGTTYTYLAIG